MPTSIGPTPQKDGRILGLFDLLDETDENSPSKRKHVNELGNDQVQATPSRKPTGEMNDQDIAKLDRTPQSKKRGMLFTTPSKPRDTSAALGRTPTSVSKFQLSTPSFLRRAPLATVDEEGNYKSPAPLRLPPKPLGRSLSSVVAGLRKMEEEALDEDLEALHEMEDDMEPASETAKPAKSVKPKEDILEPDSQAQQLLGGFDDEGLYDSTPEEETGRNGQPLRIYKKKGQKRTTRRVNMKPTRNKRPQQSSKEAPDESDAEDDAIPETQVGATRDDAASHLDLGSDPEFDPPEEDEEEHAPKPKRKSKAAKAKKESKGEGKVQKAAKKVNELAHANFKRLKLRNNGAKGPAAGSRFRRRR
ncbi:hypothetical protein M426DRAFT_324045 [Hypoxylon sp. CI-4A]|nr:hypothetical protein M426DRAFT_324045 [Hypoxylon sp. CI-4A]